MALYIPHSIFHLARLLYVRPETFGPYYVTKGLDDVKLLFLKLITRKLGLYIIFPIFFPDFNRIWTYRQSLLHVPNISPPS